MKTFQSATALVFLLASTALAVPSAGEVFKRSPPQASGIQFDCANFPDVCQNMCWGAFCVPKATDYLIWDKPSKSLARKRRRASFCIDGKKPGNNRCSKGRPGAIAGYNCDEYPFASSKSDSQRANTGGQENRCSRCVPSKQNSKQGSVIAKGYGKNGYCKNQAPCNFIVYFANYGNVPHCNAGGNGNCNADSAEMCSGPISIVQRDLVTRDTLETGSALANGTWVDGPAQFRTYGGTVLAAPQGGWIGQPVYNAVAKNQTLWEQQTEEHEYDGDEDHTQFDYMMDNMDIETDYIKELL